MSTRATANTLATPELDDHADGFGPGARSRGAEIDTEPERGGYLATRWLRPGDSPAGDWVAESDMTRARLTRRHRRFLGQVAPSGGRRD